MSEIDFGPENRVKFDKTDKVLRSFFKTEVRGNIEPDSLKAIRMCRALRHYLSPNINTVYV